VLHHAAAARQERRETLQYSLFKEHHPVPL
jgi:hypothetical protein